MWFLGYGPSYAVSSDGVSGALVGLRQWLFPWKLSKTLHWCPCQSCWWWSLACKPRREDIMQFRTFFESWRINGRACGFVVGISTKSSLKMNTTILETGLKPGLLLSMSAWRTVSLWTWLIGTKIYLVQSPDPESHNQVFLDRALANGDFTRLFYDFNVENVITTSSNHYALLINLSKQV